MVKKQKQSKNKKNNAIEQNPDSKVISIDLPVQNKFLLFTGLLLLVFAILYSSFLFGDELYAYTDIGKDAVDTYWPNIYYSIDAIEKGDITLWSDKHGTGISTAMLLDTWADPFSIVNLIAGKNYIMESMIFMLLLKFLLSGIFMYKYLSYIKIHKTVVIIASLCFAFNGFAVLWGQHYKFHSYIVFIPLVLWGLEQWMREKKYLNLVIGFVLLLMISIYFMYQFIPFLLLYAILRKGIEENSNAKNIGILVAKTIPIVLIAFGLAAVFYMPKAYAIVASPRVGTEAVSFGLFDTANYYFQAIFHLFTNNLTGVGSDFYGNFLENYQKTQRYTNYYEFPIFYAGLLNLLLIPQIIALTKGKQRTFYMMAGALMLLIIISPVFSYILNGFSTIQYRWTIYIVLFEILFGAFALNIILTKGLIAKRTLNITYISLFAVLFVSVFASSSYFDISEEYLREMLFKSFVIFIFLSIYTLALNYITKTRTAKFSLYLLLATLIIELIVISYPTVNERDTLPKDYKEQKLLYFDGSQEAIDYIQSKDSSIYRIDKAFTSALFNDALIQDFRSLRSYSSLNIKSYLEFIDQFDRTVSWGMNYINLSSRTGVNIPYLTTYLGTKYYVANHESKLPGYKKINSIGNINIYENQNDLPIIFTYDTLVRKDQVEGLSVLQREKLLLFYGMIDPVDGNSGVPYVENIENTSPANAVGGYSHNNIEWKNEAFPNNLEFSVKANTGSIEMELNQIDDTSRHISIVFSGRSSVGGKFKIRLRTENMDYDELNIGSNWSEMTTTNRNFNIGFDLPPEISNIMLEFSPGVYELSDMSLLFANSSERELNVLQKIEERKQFEFSYISYEQDHILGEITTDKPVLLNISIPYEEGWECRVNGEDQEIHKINGGMMGVFLDEGEHKIELKFHWKWLSAGIYISLISIAFFAAFIFISKKRA